MIKAYAIKGPKVLIARSDWTSEAIAWEEFGAHMKHIGYCCVPVWITEQEPDNAARQLLGKALLRLQELGDTEFSLEEEEPQPSPPSGESQKPVPDTKQFTIGRPDGGTHTITARLVRREPAAAPLSDALDAGRSNEPVAKVTYSGWNGMNVEPLESYPAVLPVGTKLYAADPSTINVPRELLRQNLYPRFPEDDIMARDELRDIMRKRHD